MAKVIQINGKKSVKISSGNRGIVVIESVLKGKTKFNALVDNGMTVDQVYEEVQRTNMFEFVAKHNLAVFQGEV